MNRTHQTFSEQEKDKLLREVENSRGSTRETLAQLGISKSTYYGWKSAAEINKGLRLPSENSARNFYLVSQALKHQSPQRGFESRTPIHDGGGGGRKTTARGNRGRRSLFPQTIVLFPPSVIRKREYCITFPPNR